MKYSSSSSSTTTTTTTSSTTTASILSLIRSRLFPLLNAVALCTSTLIFILSCSFPWYKNLNYLTNLETFEFMIFNGHYGAHLFLYSLSFILLFLFVVSQLITGLVIGLDNTICFVRINILFALSQVFQIAFFLFSNFQIWIGAFVSITLCCITVAMIYFFSIHVHYGSMGRFFKRYKRELPLHLQRGVLLVSKSQEATTTTSSHRSLYLWEYWLFQPCFSIYMTWLWIQMINILLIILFDSSQGNLQISYLGLTMDWIGCLAQCIVSTPVVLCLIFKLDIFAPIVVLVYWIALSIKQDKYMAFQVLLWVHLFYVSLGIMVGISYMMAQWLWFKRSNYMNRLLQKTKTDEEKVVKKSNVHGQTNSKTSSTSGDLTIHDMEAPTAMSCA